MSAAFSGCIQQQSQHSKISQSLQCLQAWNAQSYMYRHSWPTLPKSGRNSGFLRPKFFKNLKTKTSTTADRLGRGPAPIGFCARPAVLPENGALLCVNAAAAYTGRRNACLLAKSQLQCTIAILQRATSLSGTAVGKQMDVVSKYSVQSACNVLSGISATLRIFRVNLTQLRLLQCRCPRWICTSGQPGTLYLYDFLMERLQLKAITCTKKQHFCHMIGTFMTDQDSRAHVSRLPSNQFNNVQS